MTKAYGKVTKLSSSINGGVKEWNRRKVPNGKHGRLGIDQYQKPHDGPRSRHVERRWSTFTPFDFKQPGHHHGRRSCPHLFSRNLRFPHYHCNLINFLPFSFLSNLNKILSSHFILFFSTFDYYYYSYCYFGAFVFTC